MPLFKYVKKAFMNEWNLLGITTATALSFISGHPGVILPLAAAGEILYLAALSTHPRFQKWVDAVKRQPLESYEEPPLMDQLLSALNPQDRQQFEKIKHLCTELRRITRGKESGQDGMNRLLRIYLKLLHSKNVSESFFKTIDRKEIENNIWRTMQRLTEMGPEENDDPDKAKRRNSLKDTLATYDLRLRNYENAMKNYEFIGIEIERLSSKIASIAEMGISRQDADFISTEIDLVSDSVRDTEETMNDIESITGFPFYDKDIPVLPE